MGWTVKKHKDGKFQFYSTIVDDYIDEPKDRDESLKLLFWTRFERFMENCIKEDVLFPADWCDSDTGKINKGNDESRTKNQELMSDRQKKYNYFIEMMEKMGFKLHISDNEYELKTNNFN